MNTTVAPCVRLSNRISTRTPLWRRMLGAVMEAVQAWREAAMQRRRWRALQGLSESTLQDIGLADQMPPRAPTVSLLDYERGRW